MPDPTTLEALLARVEEGSDEDRGLDADIIATFGHRIEWRLELGFIDMDVPYVAWQEPHPDAGLEAPCPLLTGSVDDVLRLKQCLLPGAAIIVGWEGDRSDAYVLFDGRAKSAEARRSFSTESDAIPEMARALLAALLRALIVREGRP